MIVTIKILSDKTQTGKGMYDIIERYHKDLDTIYVLSEGVYKPISKVPLPEVYEIVKNIPYRRDRKPIEVVARPKHIWKHRNVGMDCKKKAILLGSYLYGNDYDYRLVSTSSKPNKRIHHVFPQVFLNGSWFNVDATYPQYKIFQPKKVTKMEVL